MLSDFSFPPTFIKFFLLSVIFHTVGYLLLLQGSSNEEMRGSPKKMFSPLRVSFVQNNQKHGSQNEKKSVGAAEKSKRVVQIPVHQPKKFVVDAVEQDELVEQENESGSGSDSLGESSGEGKEEGGSGANNILLNYLTLIKNIVSERKFYPEMAKKIGLEGKVEVEISIERSGNISQFKVFSSSQNSLFDQTALDIIAKIIAFPSFPEGLDKRSIRVIIPLNFNITNKTNDE